MKRFPALAELGPAIVVAVVAFGPGSILTGAQVGASFGPWALTAVFGATALMIGSVALAARIGVLFADSPCDELRRRLGAPVAIAVGAILFGIVAIFQYGNNVAIIAGLEALTPAPVATSSATPSDESWRTLRNLAPALLLGMNLAVIACLYLAQGLYRLVERLMKSLMALMVLAFAANFACALAIPVADVAPGSTIPTEASTSAARIDWLPLLGLIATTYSVAGAFYQSYLVKERGWGPTDAKRGQIDSIVGGVALGVVTSLILLTGALIFHGRVAPGEVEKMQIGDVAAALEPLFGPAARIVFGVGLLAAAFSSFLVNAMVGGTILSDSLKLGSRVSQPWPKALTTVALVVGMFVALAAMRDKTNTASLLALAQALTVIGLPALAAALLYLGFIRLPSGERAAPPWMLVAAVVGLLLSIALAAKLSYDLFGKFFPAT